MVKINPKEIEQLFESTLTPGKLELFVKKFQAENPSVQHEKQNTWNECIDLFNDEADADDVSPEMLLTAIEFDLAISPYTGAPFEHRVPFYQWCLMALKETAEDQRGQIPS